MASTTSASAQIDAMCSNAEYKETCEKTLSNANNTEPKELLLSAFNSTIRNLKTDVRTSALYKDAAEDPRTKGALAVCEQVLHTTMDNMRRSFKQVDKIDVNQINDYVDDVKLKTSGELLSNGLAIVSGVSKLFETLDLGKLLSGSKRVLAETAPGFLGHHARGLLGAAPGTFTPSPAGVYKEVLKVPGGANNVVFVGEGPTKTVIFGSQSFADGIPTFQTAILSIDGDDFMAKDIGIENTAGASGRQAVAVRVSGDKAVFYNVHMSSHQSTLYAHIYRQFYRDCHISGTMDIIWGDAQAVFQNCVVAVKQPLPNQDCTVTAQARNDSRAVGVTVLQNCSITVEREFFAVKPSAKAYLGRPMKAFSRAVVMESNIEGFIAPEGWTPWMGTFGLETL
ncbi:probable pectinesterase/pectinesterase inhibitor 21 [Salvia splendens]|uniref:probable pectinesterase/pectinesterase inhibitor 21 n=1 Tax=Salvia splendens TaxID=180675 RepID=UPI001C268629|nr:probable pectinesterase/pectinesterase inhibitor 21 [Salvia splendens]